MLKQALWFSFLFIFLSAPQDSFSIDLKGMSSQRFDAWTHLLNAQVEQLSPEQLRDFAFDMAPSPLINNILGQKKSGESPANKNIVSNSELAEIAALISTDLRVQFQISFSENSRIAELYSKWFFLHRMALSGLTNPDFNGSHEIVQLLLKITKEIAKDNSTANSTTSKAKFVRRLFKLIGSDIYQQFSPKTAPQAHYLFSALAKLTVLVNEAFQWPAGSELLIKDHFVDHIFLRKVSPFASQSAKATRTSPPVAPGLNLQSAIDEGYLQNKRFTSSQLLKAISANQAFEREGLDELLHFLVAQDQDQNFYRNLVDSNPALKAFAEQGRIFRESYLSFVVQSLGRETAPYFIDPVLEILKALNTTELQNDNHVLKEIHFNEAERMAWSDTLVRFSMNEVGDSSRLEELAKWDDHYLEAYEFFQQSVIKYSLLESPQTAPRQKVNVREFKNNILKKIFELRVHNFRSRMLGLNSEKKGFLQFRKDGEVFRVETVELAGAQIVFSPQDFSVRHAVLDESWLIKKVQQVLPLSPAGPDSPTLDDAHLLEAFYILDKPLAHVSYDVIMQLPQSGLTLPLSEETFRKMFRMPLRFIEDTKLEDNVSRRFQKESINRDTELAHLIALLNAHEDKSFAILRTRLFKYIEHRDKYTSVNRNLTEWIRMPEVLSTSHRLNDLRWGGWAIHPMYWRTKDIYAKLKGAPSVFLKAAAGTPRGFSLGFDEFRQKWQLKSSLRGLKKRVAIQAKYLVGVIAAVSTVAYMLDFNPFSGPPSLQPASISLNSSNESEIHSFDDIQRQRSQKLFALETGPSGIRIPKYFNYLSSFNMPRQWRELESKAKPLRDEKSMSAVVEILLNPLSEKVPTNSDLILTAEIPMQLAEFGLPIVTPSGFRLQHLDLIHSDINFALRESFLVSQLGLYYAKVPGAFNSREGVHYRAYFVRDERIRPAVAQVGNLQKDNLKKLSQEFADLGALELSNRISQVVNSKSEVNLKQLSYAFATTGYYTYSSIPTFSFPSFQYFAKYKKFLNQGRYFYQCTGANNQFVDALNRYFVEVRQTFRAFPIGGFVYTGGNSIMNAGHLHTLVTNSIANLAFSELDATPLQLDPAFRDLNDLHPFTEEERSEIKKRSGAGDESPAPEPPSKKEDLPAHVARQSGKLVLNDNESEMEFEEDVVIEPTRGERFEKLRTKMHKAISALLAPGQQHELPSSVHTWRGLEFLRFMQIFSDYFNGYLEPQQALFQILATEFYGRWAPLNTQQMSAVEERLQILLEKNRGNTSKALLAKVKGWQESFEQEQKKQMKAEGGMRYFSDLDLLRRSQNVLNFIDSTLAAELNSKTCQAIFQSK